jgi:2-oxoglutarate dehydrogenase E1 component
MIGLLTADDVRSTSGSARLPARPRGFSVHPKQPLFSSGGSDEREGGIDWGFGELLAFARLLIDGVPVACPGRTRAAARRHATPRIHDHVTGAEWTPAVPHRDQLSSDHDSALSSTPALAFEYATPWSARRARAWGAVRDFANGAQTVIDEFISSSEQEVGPALLAREAAAARHEATARTKALLRTERTSTGAEDNMVVAQPSTPASHFTSARHAYPAARPHIDFTPKQLLRLRAPSRRWRTHEASNQTVIPTPRTSGPSAGCAGSAGSTTTSPNAPRS